MLPGKLVVKILKYKKSSNNNESMEKNIVTFIETNKNKSINFNNNPPLLCPKL